MNKDEIREKADEILQDFILGLREDNFTTKEIVGIFESAKLGAWLEGDDDEEDNTFRLSLVKDEKDEPGSET